MHNLLRIATVTVIGLAATALLAGEVPDAAEKIQPLLIGAKAPDVTFKKLDGSDWNLLQAAAEKPIILIFYRGGW